MPTPNINDNSARAAGANSQPSSPTPVERTNFLKSIAVGATKIFRGLSEVMFRQNQNLSSTIIRDQHPSTASGIRRSQDNQSGFITRENSSRFSNQLPTINEEESTQNVDPLRREHVSVTASSTPLGESSIPISINVSARKINIQATNTPNLGPNPLVNQSGLSYSDVVDSLAKNIPTLYNIEYKMWPEALFSNNNSSTVKDFSPASYVRRNLSAQESNPKRSTLKNIREKIISQIDNNSVSQRSHNKDALKSFIKFHKQNTPYGILVGMNNIRPDNLVKLFNTFCEKRGESPFENNTKIADFDEPPLQKQSISPSITESDEENNLASETLGENLISSSDLEIQLPKLEATNSENGDGNLDSVTSSETEGGWSEGNDSGSLISDSSLSIDLDKKSSR